MIYALRLPPLIALLMLGACVSVPPGPSVTTLPGTGMSFEQFRADEAECRQYASAQVGGTTPNQSAADSGVASAAVGTLVGAAAGAAISGGHGAAVGAGAGLAVGALAGTGAAQGSAYHVQRRYDASYVQCMYAKGHRVPVSRNYVSSPQRPPAVYAPPPPPSAPPPY